METVGKFTYLSDMFSAGRGCEAAVTARTRCGLVNIRDCGEIMYGRRFPRNLQFLVYMFRIFIIPYCRGRFIISQARDSFL